jgi:hypothetical protein
MPQRYSGDGQILLAATAVLCLWQASSWAVMDQYIPAAILMAASVLSWLISRRMVSITSEQVVKDDFCGLRPICRSGFCGH